MNPYSKTMWSEFFLKPSVLTMIHYFVILVVHVYQISIS